MPESRLSFQGMCDARANGGLQFFGKIEFRGSAFFFFSFNRMHGYAVNGPFEVLQHMTKSAMCNRWHCCLGKIRIFKKTDH